MSSNLPFLLLIVILVGVLVFVLIAFSAGSGLRRHFRAKNLQAKLGEEPKKPEKKKQWLHKVQEYYDKILQNIKVLLSAVGIRAEGPVYTSFSMALHAFKERIGSRDYKYTLPWYAVVDLEQGDLASCVPLVNPIESPAFSAPNSDPIIKWWCFEKGVLVDISAQCFDEDSKKGWRWVDCIKAFSWRRPKRPLDGIVLALPCSWFTGNLSVEELSKKALYVSEKLLQLEKGTGLRLPVYVVLTGAEALAGFKGFATEVSLSRSEEILGWSNQHAADVSYTPKWVDDAFSSIHGHLFYESLRLFSQPGQRKYNDDIMLLPSSFMRLKEGVLSYLNHIFRVTDYRDHFLFRGLYITGKDAEDSTCFVKSLFSKKIFKEKGLARPVKQFLHTTSRLMLYLRFGFIVLVGLEICALGFGYKHIRRSVSEIRPLLAQVTQDLQTYDRYDDIDDVKGVFFGNRAHSCLSLLVSSVQWPLRTFLLPPSWTSGLPRDLDHTVFSLYNFVIARPMYLRFGAFARKLMVDPLPHITTSKKNMDPTLTKEFAFLQGYIESLESFEQHVHLYNTLPKSESMESLTKISKYLYNFAFPDFFVTNSSLIKERILEESKYHRVSLDLYRSNAEKRLEYLFQQFLKKALDPESNYSLPSQLQDLLTGVEGEGVPSLESFSLALESINQLIVFISDKSLSGWLRYDKFMPGSRYDALFSRLRRLDLISQATQERMRHMASVTYKKARAYLKSYGSPITGHFFRISEKNQLVPSDGLLALKKGLEVFLSQPFMSKVYGDTLDYKLPADKVIHWDPQIIKNAMALIEKYKVFIEDTLPGFPPDLQDTLRIVARRQLSLNIEAMLHRGRAFYDKPQADWSREARDRARSLSLNVQEVAPLFIKLLKALDSSGSSLTYNRLRDLLFKQMYQILQGVDDILSRGSFYRSPNKSFSWWKGDKLAVYQAYNMRDRQELKAYLANQVKRIARLAQQSAAPVVQFLTSDVFSTNIRQVKVIEKWRRILEQISAHGEEDAGSSVAVLESFMLDEANDITFANCFDKISEREANATSADYFLEVRNGLRRSMYKRCQVASAEKAVAKYNAVADFFNSYLANTFPFSDDVPRTSRPDEEVSDTLLIEFFKKFDTITPEMVTSLAALDAYGETWPEVEEFIDKISDVREFFEEYFAPQKKGEGPGLSFKVQFRENMSRERHGDKVLDWAVIAGDTSINLRGATREARWSLGDTVSFGFQWAGNTPLQPIAITDNPLLTQVANRSMFVFEGFWGLLRVFLLQQPEVSEGGSTSSDTLLKFIVPLGADPNGAAVSDAELYIRLLPLNSKGMADMSFKIPEFPVIAPILEKSDV